MEHVYLPNLAQCSLMHDIELRGKKDTGRWGSIDVALPYLLVTVSPRHRRLPQLSRQHGIAVTTYQHEERENEDDGQRRCLSRRCGHACQEKPSRCLVGSRCIERTLDERDVA